MYRINNCPICNNTPNRIWHGEMASFMSIRALNKEYVPIDLLECGSCGLRFSDARLEPIEVAKLYDNYRGDSYFELRHKEEPWYTRSINNDLGHKYEIVKERTDRILTLLENYQPDILNFKVLDFGGDQGHFLSPKLGGDLWVYDLSGQPPLPGIKGCTNLGKLSDQSFDLVMMGHILEHAMSPLETLTEALGCLRTGGFLYVEVPFERPLISSGLHSSISIRPIHQVHDFISTLFRLLLGWLPPGGMLKVSEHVNFFDETSLRVSMQLAGFCVKTIGYELKRQPLGRGGILFALAQLVIAENKCIIVESNG